MKSEVAALGLELDAVLIPCSGGGLIAGSAIALRSVYPDLPVYACEPENFDDTRRSLAAGARVNAPGGNIICDGLMSPIPGQLTFAINRRLLAGGLVVDDKDVLAAMAYAFRELKLVMEPSGAVALASVLSASSTARGETLGWSAPAETLIPRPSSAASPPRRTEHRRKEGESLLAEGSPRLMIDAHVHVWSLDAERYPWHQTLAHVPIPSEAATAESLIAEMDRAGVSHAVLVQPSVYGWNNDYLCDCLAKWPSRFVGVCLVDPKAEDAAERLEYWTLARGCRGLRINLIAETDPRWVLSPGRHGLWQTARKLGISIALQISPDHAVTAGKLAAANPDITFIVDYMGPAAFHDGMGITAIEELAPNPNIYYKIQSLGQDSRQPYPFEDLAPLYREALRAFGARRLLFGTDFPHMRKACSYTEAVRWLGSLSFLDEAATRRIGEDNARKLWRIGA